MTSSDLNAVIRSLIRTGEIEEMEERLILADALADVGRDEEATALRDESVSEFWTAGSRLCWGPVSDWVLIFSDGHSRFVVGDEVNKSWELSAVYGPFAGNYAHAEGVNMEDTCDRQFYLMAIADCMEPPLAVVRARSETDAIDWFCDKLNWSHIPEDALADYDQDSIHYSDGGIPCDIEALVMRDVTLVDARRK